MTTAWDVSPPLEVEISSPGLVPLRVSNDIGQDICYVFISPEVSDNWGDDRLGASEVLGGGETRLFFLSRDTYDLMVQDCSGNTLAEQYGFLLQVEGTWFLSSGTP